jgi:pimeloyl-ACP methyl ester carboxylesterase
MSQGGFVSLRAALSAPERVKAIAFIDSQAGTENPDSRPIYEAMAQNWVTDGPSEDSAETVAQIIIGPGDHSAWKEKWVARPKEDIELIFRALMDRDDLWERVPEVTCPTLVIHGDADAAISMDKAERLSSLLPGSEGLIAIGGGSHAANMTHPDEVTAALAGFLERHA